MNPSAYVPVEPREHGPDCRRGENPASGHYGLDRERCERCRALWRRLEQVGAERRASRTVPA